MSSNATYFNKEPYRHSVAYRSIPSPAMRCALANVWKSQFSTWFQSVDFQVHWCDCTAMGLDTLPLSSTTWESRWQRWWWRKPTMIESVAYLMRERRMKKNQKRINENETRHSQTIRAERRETNKFTTNFVQLFGFCIFNFLFLQFLYS